MLLLTNISIFQNQGVSTQNDFMYAYMEDACPHSVT